MDLSFFSPDKKPENPMGQLMSAPTAKAAPQQQDPMMAMLSQFFTAMMGGQQQDPLARGKNNAMTIAAMRNDPVGDRNRAYMPGAMAGTPDAAANPFTNGFFQKPTGYGYAGDAPVQQPQAMPFSNFGAPTREVSMSGAVDRGQRPPNATVGADAFMDQAMLDNAQLYSPSGNPFMDLFKRMRR